MSKNRSRSNYITERLDFIEWHHNTGTTIAIEHVLNGKNVSVTTPFVSHSINDKIVEEVRLDSVMCHLEGDEDIIGASVVENRGVFRYECGFVDGSAIGIENKGEEIQTIDYKLCINNSIQTKIKPSFKTNNTINSVIHNSSTNSNSANNSEKHKNSESKLIKTRQKTHQTQLKSLNKL